MSQRRARGGLLAVPLSPEATSVQRWPGACPPKKAGPAWAAPQSHISKYLVCHALSHISFEFLAIPSKWV